MVGHAMTYGCLIRTELARCAPSVRANKWLRETETLTTISALHFGKVSYRNVLAECALESRGSYRISKSPRIAFGLIFAFIFAVWMVLPASATESTGNVPASFDPNNVFTYVSERARAQSEPAPVVIALHGMGSDGKGFCQGFLRAAERNGWVVMAPTFRYRNWRDPILLAEDDVALTKQLVDYVDELPGRLGLAIENRVSIFGFSRGAQLAHRFALAYPERTRSIAAMSAGSYTLPTATAETTSGMKTMAFPYGTADLAARFRRESDPRALAKVAFWVAVGANDNQSDDVARQWDLFQGRDRVQRARAFAASLGSIGVPVTLTVFPNINHQMAPEMIAGATAFLEKRLQVAPAALAIVNIPPAPIEAHNIQPVVAAPLTDVAQASDIKSLTPNGSLIGLVHWFVGLLQHI